MAETSTRNVTFLCRSVLVVCEPYREKFGSFLRSFCSRDEKLVGYCVVKLFLGFFFFGSGIENCELFENIS